MITTAAEAGRGSVFTRPFNVTGQPAVAAARMADDGLPRGVQLVADLGREDLLVRLAQLEEAAVGRAPPAHSDGPGTGASDPMHEAAHDAARGREQTGAWTPAIEC